MYKWASVTPKQQPEEDESTKKETYKYELKIENEDEDFHKMLVDTLFMN